MDKNESLDDDPAEDFVKAGKHEFVKLEYLDLRGNEIKKIDKLSLSPDPKNWYITQSTAKKKMLEGILCKKNYFVGRVRG